VAVPRDTRVIRITFEDELKTKHCPTFAALMVIALIPIGGRSLCADPANAIEVLDRHQEYVYMVSFSRDGRFLVTAAGDNSAIIWDVQKQTPLHVLPHDAAVYAAVFSPDGKHVASGSGDGSVILWNTADGGQVARQKQHGDAVYCVSFSPDGQRLASAGGSTDGGDTTCRVWRRTDLKRVSELTGHKRQVYGVAFSPDGKSIATGSSDKTIRLWNRTSGEFRTLEGHTSDVYRCVFSPSGDQLASTSQDGTVRVWSIKTGDATLVFDGSKRNPSYATTYSSDGRTLAAVSDDHRLRIWRTADLHLQSQTKISRSALYAVDFSPISGLAAVAGEDGKVYLITNASRP